MEPVTALIVGGIALAIDKRKRRKSREANAAPPAPSYQPTSYQRPYSQYHDLSPWNQNSGLHNPPKNDYDMKRRMSHRAVLQAMGVPLEPWD